MVVAAVALAGAGVIAGMMIDDDPEPVGVSAVDVGFLQDMQAHHAQAVEMAVLIRDRTEDEEIRNLALDIELTQQHQIGQMYGLLASWGQSQTNSEPMAWMEPSNSPADDPHAQMDGMGTDSPTAMSMPGMASQADLDQLRGLRGRPAERLFLDLMIDHHRGGLPMAEDASANADDPWVRTLAARIVEAQSAELQLLLRLLDDRGGPLE
ncbi:DUF305 domain-containing protein [Nocardioides sp. TF02-7]|uniref:DUF305 domain-containing protein n=1 Tax=Nocardioides sp. TF02-7 TaxID=2917724 RepID=UPI001F062252|nr:DUF305 domain-containing protein [Nocardioides sp. TF02-7]UMG92247.1 DUF305 domain-containing protein [Nocardioides sp. TF02-7]